MNELANNTSVNMSRNCQEISTQVGKELCALIDQEFDKKREEDNKKRLELERHVNNNHIYTISIVCDIILSFDEQETKMTTRGVKKFLLSIPNLALYTPTSIIIIGRTMG
jgi:hypothetical protein